VKSQLPAAEWDFSILAQSSSDGLKLRRCFDWEYFREVYRQFPKFQQKIVNGARKVQRVPVEK
jgi:hypothetical protein